MIRFIGVDYSVLSLNESLKTYKVIFVEALFNGHFENYIMQKLKQQL